MASRGIPTPLLVLGALLALAGAAYGFASWRIGHPTWAPRALPEGLVSIDSGTGRQLLAEADASADYRPLLRWFVPQQKLTWCGVASATIVVNALGLNEPGPALRQPQLFRRGKVVKSRWATSWGGMTLAQVGGFVDAWGGHANVHYASDGSAERFRAIAEGNLGDAHDFLVVNYDRGAVGQGGSGHISPVAAWDRETDRVLVLDTASYRYPFTWVRVSDLFRAMQTLDDTSGKSRGYVTVSR